MIPAEQVDATAGLYDIGGKVKTWLAAGGVYDDIDIAGFEGCGEVVSVVLSDVDRLLCALLAGEREPVLDDVDGDEVSDG